jgi:hypothetical protein
MINELKSTGLYDTKKMDKYFSQQVREAIKWGATEEQAKVNAQILLRQYKHNFLIRTKVEVC